MNEPEFYDVKGGAEYLDIHPVTLRNWIKVGKVPAHRMGGKLWRIRREDLLKLQSGAA